MRTACLLAAAIAALLVAGCSRSDAPDAGAARQFKVRGILRGISPDRATLDIQHEAIPNFMPTMTMPFTVKDPMSAADLKIGDALSFRMTVNDKEAWIDNVTKISADGLDFATASPGPTRSASSSARLRAGEPIPPFQLTDHTGKRITAESLRGQPYVMTFIFTRCPIPNFCPLMNRHFGELQQAIQGASGTPLAQTRLLSVSFDPAFDTPEVLSEYAQREKADPRLWHFATGEKEQIEELTKRFAVLVRPEGGTISHGLATALVDANGKIVEIWRGNAWKPADIIEKINGLSVASR